MRLVRRENAVDATAWDPAVPATVQQVYANRGVTSPDQISKDPTGLLNPHELMGIEKAVDLLVDAIVTQKHVTIAGDYDCDGATGTATAVRGLKLLGLSPERIRFIIPDRHRHGYGLSVGLVDDVPKETEIIMTVDSGIASNEGVAHAKALGYTVIITDHHLPGDVTPIADAIVNPNQRGDDFPSKALAGVGVMFYVLLAVRTRLKKMGLPGGDAPLFHHLAPVVAIGTVADLVTLDHNNRIIVSMGLQLIRQGDCSEGIHALMLFANKEPRYFTSTDIAFGLAPMLNSAGRLADMTLGVKLLLTDDQDTALNYARLLSEINARRKQVQATMVTSAESIVDKLPPGELKKGVVVYDKDFQGGIVGLVASKLKETLNRPVIAFANSAGGNVSGSARSVPGLHLRDALAIVDAKSPGLIKKFGGHAMAAGLTVADGRVKEFEKLFNETIETLLTPEMMESVIYSDGELPPREMNVEFCKYLETCGPWGQGFPKPVFDGVFEVKDFRILKEQHIKFELYDTRQGDEFDAIWFFSYKGLPPPMRFRMAYELSLNVYRGLEKVQLLARYIEPIE